MIELEDVRFQYRRGGFGLHVGHLAIEAGRLVAFVGPSGSGKTTLVSLISGILAPASGALRVGGVDLASQPDARRRRFRIARIGMVFQDFELLEYLTVRDNVLLPYRINRALRLEASVRERAGRLAEAVGLGDKLDRYPGSLSHGERQRLAICRAMIAEPAILIADEPTGNLDAKTARRILELMFDQARRSGATFLMVTHDGSLLDGFDRVVDVTELSGRPRA